MLRSRYRRIIIFFARLLLSLAWWELALPRLGLRSWALRTRPQRLRRAAIAFRGLAVQMGGVLIKVGQFLSTRVDVLPPEFTQELQDLQDQVPAEDFAAIRRVAEQALEAPLEEKFEFFDPQPLAAASLGQVHRARLRASSPSSGPSADVVVKVLRPNIEAIIQTDLHALKTVATWLNRYPLLRRRASIPTLLEEFTRVLWEEVDYLAEGRNAETFAENFAHYPGVRVPIVHWSHTTRRTLTLENVLAIRITDYQAIAAAGIDASQVADRLLDTYLKQIFEDGFFHADPHPGNLFVQPLRRFSPSDDLTAARLSPEEWRLTFIDFGMVGRVPANVKEGLREMVIGVGLRDATRVLQAYQMLNLLLPGADLDMIERAQAEVFDRYWGKSMSDLTTISVQEMTDFAEEFREIIYDMPFQAPQNIIFLARCVSILSGMCTGLNPNFNVWQHLAPFARKLMTEEARKSGQTWLNEAEKVGRSVLAVPQKLDRVLAKLERGDVAVRSPELTTELQRLEAALHRLTGAVVFAALLLSGLQLVLSRQEWWGAGLLGAAGLTLLRVIFKRR